MKIYNELSSEMARMLNVGIAYNLQVMDISQRGGSFQNSGTVAGTGLSGNTTHAVANIRDTALAIVGMEQYKRALNSAINTGQSGLGAIERGKNIGGTMKASIEERLLDALAAQFPLNIK